MEGTNDALKLIAQAIQMLKDYNIADEPNLLTAIDLLVQAIDKLA